jgi:hypothetical protein
VGSGGGRHLLEDGRQGEADRAADRIEGRAGGGAQPGAAAVLFDSRSHLTEIGEIVDDALPFDSSLLRRAARRSIIMRASAGKLAKENGSLRAKE